MKRQKAKIIIENMVREFDTTMTHQNMLDSYKWFNLASGIEDELLTLELIKEVYEENSPKSILR